MWRAHPHLDRGGARSARQGRDAAFREIKSIHCSWRAAPASVPASLQYPATVEAAKFSVGYLVPYALIHGAPKIRGIHRRRRCRTNGVTRAGDDRHRERRSRARARCVTASPAMPRSRSRAEKCSSSASDYASGSNRNPMTTAQVETKFNDCAAQTWTAPSVRAGLPRCSIRCAERRSVRDFWTLIRRARDDGSRAC